MKKLTTAFFNLALLAVALLFCSTSARATTWDWDPTLSTTGGSDSTGTLNSTWSQGGGGNWYNATSATGPANYTGGFNDTVVLGSANTPTVGSFTVNVTGTVDVGTIDFNNYSASNIGVGGKQGTYTISGGFISGTANQALTIVNGGASVGSNNNAVLTGVSFINAQNYQVIGATSSTLTSVGVEFTGGTFFDNTVILGTGNDFGTLLIQGNLQKGQVTTNPTGQVVVNNGWTFQQGATNKTVTQYLTINGLGIGGGGAIQFGSGSNSVANYVGNITVGSDSAIMATAGDNGTNKYPNQVHSVTANLSGTGNLYLGYQSQGNTNTTPIALNGITSQQFIIGGTNPSGNTSSTNTGATIVFNSSAGDNSTATGGTVAETVQLGQTSGLSSATTLVLGETGTYNETSSIGAPGNLTTGNGWKTSDGVLDLHGFNQSVKGLIIGGVGQGVGGTANVLVAGKNLILNNSGSGTSMLTITGTTGNAVSTGFGGVIEDSQAINTTGAAQSVGTGNVGVTVDGGTLKLAGANTYTGGTTVENGGLLQVGTSSPNTAMTNSIIGTFGAATGALNLSNNATVDLEGQNESVGAVTFGTTVSGSANSMIQTSSGTSTLNLTTGGITVNANSSGTVGANVTVNAAATSTVAATGAFTLNGTLNGAVTNNGLMTVASGGNANGKVTVASTGTLAANGTVSSADVTGSLNGTGTVTALTLESGSKVTPGTSGVGTLSLGSVDVKGATTLNFALSSGTPMTLLNQLTITSSFLNEAGNGAVTVDLTGGTGASGTSQLVLINGPSNFSTGDFNLQYTGSDSGYLEILNNDLIFQYTVTPEPSTWAMFLGGVVLLVAYQRRRHNS